MKREDQLFDDSPYRDDDSYYDPKWWHQLPLVCGCLGLLAIIWITNKIGLW